jgi:hypothetical protein
MAKIAIISYEEDQYDRNEIYDMTPEDFDPQDVKIYDTKTLKAQDIANIASWCHSCGEHGLKIDVKIQPDNG